MAKEYGLNLAALVKRAASAHTGFFETGKDARLWASRPLGSDNTWDPEGNPDTAIPKLQYSGNESPDTEALLFAVHFDKTDLRPDQVQIIVAIGRDRRQQGVRRVASPFIKAGQMATVLGLGEVPLRMDPGVFCIGPYKINLPPVVRKGDSLSFEFTLTCIVDLGNGDVRQFGYDPELEIDVNN